MLSAQSLPLPHTLKMLLIVIFLFTKLASLSEMITSSAPIGVVFCVNPWTSTVGVIATGVLETSKPICCHKVPVMRTSLPLASVATTAFAVNPVLVPHAMLSLVLDSVLIDVVLPDMSVERASRATLIDPDIDPRVNI